MEVEDVIELGSSDEESAVPPRKKMKTVENAMVHIPTNIHGVTIKPVKVNSTNTQKLFSGKNITVTKIPKPISQASKARQLKTPEKPVRKPLKGVTKRKVVVKSNIIQNRTPLVINPFSQLKKNASQSFVNCGVTKLLNPIPIANLPALKKLPPSVTIKKTGTTVKPSGNIVNIPKVVPKHINTIKKRKNPVVQTVELDDEEPQQSTERPKWYVRPEEQTKTEVASTQENLNNKEPEKPAYIEITIEDSPIKPPKTKRTRELSIDAVVTIEDSPNKDGAMNVNADPNNGSDDEPNTTKKIPHSKKKLKYEPKSKTIEETHTFEIEIDPIAIEESTIAFEKGNKITTLTPDIVEVEESAVEIAQNPQGDVSVVQVKPAQSEQVAGPSTEGNDKDENEFSSTYLSFINLCLELENSDDMKKIVEKKIKTYYRQVPKEYTQSEEFTDMVLSKVLAIKAAPEKMYLYIKDIVDELNLQRKLAKQMPIPEEKPKEEETFSLGKDGDFDTSKQRQIRKLEKTLKKLNRAIHKLETQEVDFDDDEDSVYLLTEKYKEKMVRVHAKFCQLTNSKMPSEPRVVIEPRPGLAAGPAKRLEAWINRNTSLTFPDFHDVLRCVKEANVEDKLDWTDAFIMEEARDLFIRCGKKLQRRRQEKEWRIATSRVTLMEDPAEQSSELKKRLEDNRRVASTKETEVFKKFSDRQNQLKLEAVDINDKEAEESPVESEEEENDESLSLESKQRRKERLKRLLQEQSKKNSSKKTQLTGTTCNEEIVSDVKPDDNKADTANKQPATYDDNSIQSLSDDDSNEIGSDVDELHLLQKLHSEQERRSDSSPESSDSETPIAISDTLDSSSDEGNKDKQEKPSDIISIENSSYSDDSDSQQRNEKTNKAKTVIIEEIVDKNMDVECSSEIVAVDPFEDALLTSSDTESNGSGLLSSEHSKSGQDVIDSTEKCLKERVKITPEEKSPSITSKSMEICTDTNSVAKANHSKENVSNECMNSIILDKNSDPAPESNLEALKTDSNIHDHLVTTCTSKQRMDAFKSDTNNKSNTEKPDVEEPTINSISQAPTIDDSDFSLTPVSVDSCINAKCDDIRAMVTKLDSTVSGLSNSFDYEEILATSSLKSLENEVTNDPSARVTESKEPTDGVLEGLAAFRSGDVCIETEMGSEILISNVVSIRKPDLADETLKENLNPNQDLDDTTMTQHDSGTIISNGNNSDLLHSVTNSSTNNDTTGVDIQENNVVTEKPVLEQAVHSVEKKTESHV